MLMTLCRILSPLGRTVLRPLTFIAAVCSFASVLRAELPLFRLDAIYPPCSKAGAAVSVGVTAVDGGEAKDLLFSHPGLSGVWKEKGRFEVTISPDVPVGMYEVRAAGSLGFSNPRSFLVAKEDQVLPAKAAASVTEAIELKSGVAVVGKVTAAASDHFKFHLKQGERALVLCEAQALDSRLKPMLELADAAGQKVLLTQIKTTTGGALLDFRAPREGDYFLRLHDLTFGGGAEFFYRLVLSQAPYVDLASAPVLQAGGKRKVTLYGRQLPQGRPGVVKAVDGVVLEELEIEIDAPDRPPGRVEGLALVSGFDVDGFSFRLPSPAGPSNPLFFMLSPGAPILEPLSLTPTKGTGTSVAPVGTGTLAAKVASVGTGTLAATAAPVGTGTLAVAVAPVGTGTLAAKVAPVGTGTLAAKAASVGTGTLAAKVAPVGTGTVAAKAAVGGTGTLGGEMRFVAPALLAGHFYPRGNVDGWSFEAKKGEVWRLEVISQRLGLPTNPFLLVQKNGTDVAEGWGPDVDPGGTFLPMPLNDPTLRFEAKEDGVYVIRVRDLSGNNVSNPASAYVLSVRKEAADFRLVATVIPPPEITAQVISAPHSALIRAGGTFAVRVFAARKDGFTGDIELSAEGLPLGVSCEPTRILAGKNDGYVILSAQEKLPAFMGAIRIVGKANVGGHSVSRQARCAVTRWASANVTTAPLEDYLVQDLILGVLPGEVSPIALTPKSEGAREVAAGGKLEVALKVERRGEFKDVLKLKTAGAPGVEQVKEVDVDAKADSAKVVLDTAALKLPVGRHTVYFTTLSTGKFRGKELTTTFFSSPFTFEIK